MTADDAPAPFSVIDVSEADIQEAMGEIQGYLDITPDDFRLIYKAAVTHAAQRVCATRTARDVMRPAPPSVTPETGLLRLGESMALEDVSFMPVVSDAEGTVCGVVTARDLVAAVRRDPGKDLAGTVKDFCAGSRRCLSQRLSNARVADIMKDPVTLHIDDPASRIKAMQRDTGHAAYPVVDAGGRLLGVVTLGDIVRGCCL